MPILFFIVILVHSVIACLCQTMGGTLNIFMYEIYSRQYSLYSYALYKRDETISGGWGVWGGGEGAWGGG